MKNYYTFLRSCLINGQNCLNFRCIAGTGSRCPGYGDCSNVVSIDQMRLQKKVSSIIYRCNRNELLRNLVISDFNIFYHYVIVFHFLTSNPSAYIESYNFYYGQNEFNILYFHWKIKCGSAYKHFNMLLKISFCDFKNSSNIPSQDQDKACVLH